MPNIQVLYDQPELGANENKGYTGKTDEQGRYTLRPMIGAGTGAPPGTYRVSLSTAADPSAAAPKPSVRQTTIFYPEAPPPPTERVPPAYRGGKLSMEIPADGKTDANFELKSR